MFASVILMQAATEMLHKQLTHIYHHCKQFCNITERQSLNAAFSYTTNITINAHFIWDQEGKK